VLENKACLLLIQINGNKDTNYLVLPTQAFVGSSPVKKEDCLL
jgi:hypothetical protein